MDFWVLCFVYLKKQAFTPQKSLFGRKNLDKLFRFT